MKKCTHCELEKPYEDYYWRKGYCIPICKICHNKKSAEYRMKRKGEEVYRERLWVNEARKYKDEFRRTLHDKIRIKAEKNAPLISEYA